MDFDKYFYDDEQDNGYRQGKISQDREYHEESKDYLSARRDNCWQSSTETDNTQNCRWKDAGEPQRNSGNRPRASGGCNSNNSNNGNNGNNSNNNGSGCSCNSRRTEDIRYNEDTTFEDTFYENDTLYDDTVYDEATGYDNSVYDDATLYDDTVYENNNSADTSYEGTDESGCGCGDDNSGDDTDNGDNEDNGGGCDSGDGDNCDYEDGCCDGNDCMDDDYCTDNNANGCPCAQCNGCVQNKQGSYFRGQGEDLPFGGCKRAYYIIKNPSNSDVDIFLDKITHANLSSNPMRVNIFYCATMTGNLTEANNIVTGNSNNCSDMGANAQIFFGNRKKMSDGTLAQTICVPAFTTISSEIKGSAILSPGFSCIVEIICVTGNAQGWCVESFDWWEAPAVCFDCQD